MTSGDAAMSGEDLKSATEEQLRAAVEAAEIAALLPTLAHLTGDLGLLREELRPDQLLLMQDDGGLLPDIAAQAREAALEAPIRHRDAGAPPAPEPSPEALHQSIAFRVGPEIGRESGLERVCQYV